MEEEEEEEERAEAEGHSQAPTLIMGGTNSLETQRPRTPTESVVATQRGRQEHPIGGAAHQRRGRAGVRMTPPCPAATSAGVASPPTGGGCLAPEEEQEDRGRGRQ